MPRSQVFGVPQLRSAGATVDAETRNAHNLLVKALQAYGLVPTSPMDYVNVQGWWDAEDVFPAGTIGNGQSLFGSPWPDRSGYGRDLIAMPGDALGALQPHIYRSFATVALTDVKQQGFLAGTGRLSVTNAFTLAQPFAMTIVHTVNAFSADRHLIDFRSDATSCAWRIAGNNQFYINCGTAVLYSGVASGSAVPVVDTLIVSGGNATWRRNGVQLGTGSTGTNGITALTYNSDRAKTTGNPEPNTFAMVLYVYETDAQVLLLEQWLATQKGVTF